MKTDLSTSTAHDRAIEIAVATAGHKFPQLSALRSPRALSHRFAAKTDDYSMVLLDVTLDTAGALRLIEANGSNAALSSLTATGDDSRAAHMCATLTAKYRGEERGVALLGHQAGFLHIPEFFARAGRFSEFVSAQWPTSLRGTDESLGDETVTVIAGELGAIAHHCAEKDGRLFYRDRPAVFATNTNLLPELARQGRISYRAGHAELSTRFFHEGKLVPLIHDKSAQQRVADGTGIVPLRHAAGHTRAECLAEATRLRNGGNALVLKMNGGSGGAGIEFLPPWLSDSEVEVRWDELVASAAKKYGAAVEQTLYPVRIFEFTRSTGYEVAGRSHLWDLRIQCLVTPGAVEVAPSVVRLCPEPFDECVFARGSVVSNLTGRPASLDFMRSSWQPADNGIGTTLESCGFTSSIYDRLLSACVAWCERAMALSN